MDHAVPRIISSLNIDGFSAESAFAGEEVSIIQKAILTSFDPLFYTLSKNAISIIAGKYCQSLLVRSNTTETKIFEDNFPISLEIRAKKNIKEFQLVFENDFADITGVSFKDAIFDVNPLEGEKVICILSEGYLHGLYFDFTGKLKPEVFKSEIAYLYRQLRYFHIYQALENGAIGRIIAVGWFPFVQLLGSECHQIISLTNENRVDKIAAWLNEAFTNERVKLFTDLWTSYSIYQKKKIQISEGVDCFLKGSFAASISTLTPMVEGIFNDYLMAKTGKGLSYNGEAIAESIYKTANIKADNLSLLLPEQFKEYLIQYFFKNTKSSTSSEATRHVVGHGRAEDKAFTKERALQIILTLDQLFFFMDK